MFKSAYNYQGKTLFCGEQTFWRLFYKDLDDARKIVHIVSPFIAVKRSGNLSKHFRELIDRGVEIMVYTRYVTDHDEQMRINAKFSIHVLKSMGIKFRFISKIHCKIAIIDNRICWSGSLNILSWNSTPELMNRFECAKVANEFLYDMNL